MTAVCFPDEGRPRLFYIDIICCVLHEKKKTKLHGDAYVKKMAQAKPGLPLVFMFVGICMLCIIKMQLR